MAAYKPSVKIRYFNSKITKLILWYKISKKFVN